MSYSTIDNLTIFQGGQSTQKPPKDIRVDMCPKFN